MAIAETPAEALARIQGGFSENDKAVLIECFNRGIEPTDIAPRENVLTLHAWKAKGRRVAKGAISIRVLTWVPCSGKRGAEPADVPEGDGGAEGKPKPGHMRPKTAYLFHITQTVEKDGPRDARPEAWQNPALIRPGIYDIDSENGEGAADEVADEVADSPELAEELEGATA